jgi:hypothetical protein
MLNGIQVANLNFEKPADITTSLIFVHLLVPPMLVHFRSKMQEHRLEYTQNRMPFQLDSNYPPLLIGKRFYHHPCATLFLECLQHTFGCSSWIPHVVEAVKERYQIIIVSWIVS